MSNFVRMLFVRHGESEGNDNIEAYIKKGDSKVGLTPKGWRQVVGTGGGLKGYYTEKNVTEWPVTFLSPHQRTRDSLSGIVHGLDGYFPGKPKLYEDFRLTEKFFGAASLLELPDDEMDPRVIETIKRLSKLTYTNDPLSTANLFGESTKVTRAMVKSLIDGTLARDIEGGKNEFLFVVHGAIIQAFIMNWMHIRPEDKNKIGAAAGLEGNPNNGDLIEISGTKGNWSVTKIWDGPSATPCHFDMLEAIRPFSFDDLPPVPLEFLRRDI